MRKHRLERRENHKANDDFSSVLLGRRPDPGKARPSLAASPLPQLTTVHYHIHFVDQQTEAPRVVQPGKVAQLVNGRVRRTVGIKTQTLHYDALSLTLVFPHQQGWRGLRRTAHKSSLKTEDDDADLPGPRLDSTHFTLSSNLGKSGLGTGT